MSGVLHSDFQRADVIPGCDLSGGPNNKFQRLNPACFTQSALGVYGNTRRNFLRQPGINNWDMGFGKNFLLTERLRFGLHVDTFNTFNHHQYAGNVGALITAGSGGNVTISNGLGSSNFGQITGASSSRVIQLSGKLIFLTNKLPYSYSIPPRRYSVAEFFVASFDNSAIRGGYGTS